MTGQSGVRKQARQGFTLLEMTIVLAIVAVIAGAGMSVFSASLLKQQGGDTQGKMLALQQALYNYRMAFNRLPCPADLTQAVTSANFGVQASAADCTGAPAANFTAGLNGGIAEGMIPTKTLRLPDDFAFDGWGRRIVYAVSVPLTASNAFTTIGPDTTNERIRVNDSAGTARTTTAAYVLLSMGPNGHGAWPRKGGATRINALSSNADEQDNCDCNASMVLSGFDGTFVQKLPTKAANNSQNVFDDIVMFGTRSDLRSPTE